MVIFELRKKGLIALILVVVVFILVSYIYSFNFSKDSEGNEGVLHTSGLWSQIYGGDLDLSNYGYNSKYDLDEDCDIDEIDVAIFNENSGCGNCLEGADCVGEYEVKYDLDDNNCIDIYEFDLAYELVNSNFWCGSNCDFPEWCVGEYVEEADFSGDGCINGEDGGSFLSASYRRNANCGSGCPSSSCTGEYVAGFDLNEDDCLNGRDLLILSSEEEKSCVDDVKLYLGVGLDLTEEEINLIEIESIPGDYFSFIARVGEDEFVFENSGGLIEPTEETLVEILSVSNSLIPYPNDIIGKLNENKINLKWSEVFLLSSERLEVVGYNLKKRVGDVETVIFLEDNNYEEVVKDNEIYYYSVQTVIEGFVSDFSKEIVVPVSDIYPRPENVLVVVNDNEPGNFIYEDEEISVGKYYALRRGIPEENIFHVQVDPNLGRETSSEQEFREGILEPMKNYIVENELDIYFVVNTYGVPLRVLLSSETLLDDHSVGYIRSLDAVLSVGLSNDLNEIYGENTNMDNPYFIDNCLVSPCENNRFFGEQGENFYIVARLDGSSPEEAKGLVDNAILAEQNFENKKLDELGNCYIDDENVIVDGYYINKTIGFFIENGVDCIIDERYDEIGVGRIFSGVDSIVVDDAVIGVSSINTDLLNNFLGEFIPLNEKLQITYGHHHLILEGSVVIDGVEYNILEGFVEVPDLVYDSETRVVSFGGNDYTFDDEIIIEANDVMFYYGWYGYGRYIDVFDFNLGAMGIHIDSCSACSMRGGTSWVVNSVRNNITATIGATDEPFLTSPLTRVNLFFNYLFEGHNFGEAAYFSTEKLGWRFVYVGDPLYTPFPRKFSIPKEVVDGGNGGNGGGNSGGGGTRSYWTKTYVPNEEELTQGVSQELEVKKRIKINVGSGEHHVGVVDIGDTSATINVSSKIQQAILFIGEEKKFDVNEDNYYDIYVRLNSIQGGKANFTIKTMREYFLEDIVGSSEFIEEPEEESNFDYLIISLVVIGVVGLVLVSIKVKKVLDERNGGKYFMTTKKI